MVVLDSKVGVTGDFTWARGALIEYVTASPLVTCSRLSVTVNSIDVARSPTGDGHTSWYV